MWIGQTINESTDFNAAADYCYVQRQQIAGKNDSGIANAPDNIFHGPIDQFRKSICPMNNLCAIDAPDRWLN